MIRIKITNRRKQKKRTLIKMNKYLIYSIILILFYSCKKDNTISESQAKKFVKYFGSFSQDNSTGFVQDSDEGFFIVGSFTSLTNGMDVAIVKTDKYGNEVWSKTYGDSLNNFGNDIIIDGDSLLVIGTNTANDETTDIWLLKLDKNGNYGWGKRYGTNSNDEGISLTLSNDGGYILAGNSSKSANQNPEGNKDIYLIKTDAYGNVIWQDPYGYNGDEECSQIITTSDGYTVIGTTNSQGAQNDIWVFNVNEKGNAPNREFFGGSGNDLGNSIIETDNGFLIVGTSNSFENNSQVYCANIPKNLTSGVIWEKTYGGSKTDIGNHIITTANGNYLIVGSTESSGQGLKDQYLLNITSSGTTIWTNTFGHTDDDIATKAIQTTDGGFAILGTTSFDNNQMISLIKTNETGLITE